MTDTTPNARAISVGELNDLIGNHEDVLIVDVREREKYAQGHIPGALAVPIGALELAADATSIACDNELVLARAGIVVLCCQDERRSRVAAQRLERLGFSVVYYLAGGLAQWQAESLPLARP